MCLGPAVALGAKAAKSGAEGAFDDTSVFDNIIKQLDEPSNDPSKSAGHAHNVRHADVDDQSKSTGHAHNFRHADVDDQSNSTGLAHNVRHADVDDQLLGKTKLCKFWSRGHCSRGRACTFAHGRKELREQPNLFRTELCFEFMSTGTCYHGAACKYAHNEREIRASMVTPQVHVQQQRLPKDFEDDLSTQPADRDLISRLAAMEEEAGRLRAQIRAMVQAASASVSKPTCLSTASESWSSQTTAQTDSDPRFR